MKFQSRSRRCTSCVINSQSYKKIRTMHRHDDRPSSVANNNRLYHCNTRLLFIIAFIINSSRPLPPIALAQQDSNHYFCGTSWGDASENCNDRQHCPSGTDDECETDGHICFGGTTCDSMQGHGNGFKYANVPYDDISNTRFCGEGWNAAIDNCR